MSEEETAASSKQQAPELTEREKVEWVANTAAEDGDPDVMEIGMLALEGRRSAIEECLAFWELWKWKRTG